jgi:signal transduction histidine kinase
MLEILLVVGSGDASAATVLAALTMADGAHVLGVDSSHFALEVARRLQPTAVLFTGDGAEVLAAARRLAVELPGTGVVAVAESASRGYEDGIWTTSADPGALAEVLAAIRTKGKGSGMLNDFSKDEVTREMNRPGSGELGARELSLDRLERLDRLETAAVLATGLAHDLATPLIAMKNSLADLSEVLNEVGELQGSPTAAPQVAAALDRGRAAAVELDEVSDYMHRLTRDFMRFARDGRADPEASADLSAAVRAAVRYTRTALVGRAVLDVRMPHSIRVAVDERTMVRVLVNLLLNAGKAFKRNDPGTNRIAIHVERRGAVVRLDVSDNAGGIPDRLRPHLFTPFASAKVRGHDPGLGVGLAVSRALIRQAGGELELQATDATETVFRCTIPAIEG